MIPKNANEAEYTLAWIKDVECLFSEERIDSATVPEGFHKYDIRHTDNDWGQPCTVEQQVTVNYYGSVLMTQALDFGGKDYIDISDEDDFIDSGDVVTIDEFMEDTPPTAGRRSAQDRTMRVLIVEPMKAPYAKEIPHTLGSMQEVVGGLIQAVYPSREDQIAVVCNDEGKLMGLPPNRPLRDDRGMMYDYLAGTFFVCGLKHDDFASLSPALEKKYTEKFSGEMILPQHEPKLRQKKFKAPER